MPSPEEPVAPSAAVDDERLGLVLDDSDKEPEADMLAVEETPAELDGEAPSDSEAEGLLLAAVDPEADVVAAADRLVVVLMELVADGEVPLDSDAEALRLVEIDDEDDSEAAELNDMLADRLVDAVLDAEAP